MQPLAQAIEINRRDITKGLQLMLAQRNRGRGRGSGAMAFAPGIEAAGVRASKLVTSLSLEGEWDYERCPDKMNAFPNEASPRARV